MVQTLWPDHCVQGTPGAAFHSELLTNRAQLVIRKGFRGAIDSYPHSMRTTAAPRRGSPLFARAQLEAGSLAAARLRLCVAIRAARRCIVELSSARSDLRSQLVRWTSLRATQI